MPEDPPFDPSAPSIAGIWDYWLGGVDHLPADEEAAARIARLNPDAAEVAREARTFLGLAVPWLAERGITQFLDLGAGMPTAQNTHEIVRAVIPDGRVAYVDNNPVAFSHADALLTQDGVATVLADLAQPAAVLSNAAVRSCIDPGRPCGVIFSSVLHLFAAGDALEIVAGYTARIAPGSYVVISVARADSDSVFEEAKQAVSAAGTLYNFTLDEIQALFTGLEMVPPGLVPGRWWRGGMPAHGLRPSGRAYLLGGVARKPG